jgi:hypothetical protein
MELRLHPDGVKAFDEWRRRPGTSLEDEQLVARVLVDYAAQDGWQDHWYHYGDPADPAITVVQPREGLFIHVQRWTGGAESEFSVTIIRCS